MPNDHTNVCRSGLYFFLRTPRCLSFREVSQVKLMALTNIGEFHANIHYPLAGLYFLPTVTTLWVKESCLPWPGAETVSYANSYRDPDINEHSYICAYIDAFLIALDNATEPEVTYDES